MSIQEGIGIALFELEEQALSVSQLQDKDEQMLAFNGLNTGLLIIIAKLLLSTQSPEGGQLVKK